jgi:lysophospholipase L1-like esterase
MPFEEWSSATAPVRARAHRLLHAFGLQIVLALTTLAVTETLLQVFRPTYLKVDQLFNTLQYAPDPELGWFPVLNSQSSGDIRIRHNSLGLRDVEYEPSSKPAILIVGDSMVWGYSIEEDERFSNLLRAQLPGHAIVNAGVAGYGTDQEYLLLKRLWQQIKPDIVVLVVCIDNDHRDNTHNLRYNAFKPYFEMTPDGNGRFLGQPVARSRQRYFSDNWLFENSWLARLAVSAYVELRHPRIVVADPTETLLGMIRDLVETNGAKFLVGLQSHEPPLEASLRRMGVPYASFDEAPRLRDGIHWTSEGQALVANRIMKLLSDTGNLGGAATARPVGVEP